MNSKLRKQLLRLMRYSNTLTPYKLDEPLDPLVNDALSDTEKAIRQAVGEEMLELVGINEPPSEYDKVAKAIRNKLRAELRQKIKQWQGGEAKIKKLQK